MLKTKNENCRNLSQENDEESSQELEFDTDWPGLSEEIAIQGLNEETLGKLMHLFDKYNEVCIEFDDSMIISLMELAEDSNIDIVNLVAEIAVHDNRVINYLISHERKMHVDCIGMLIGKSGYFLDENCIDLIEYELNSNSVLAICTTIIGMSIAFIKSGCEKTWVQDLFFKYFDIIKTIELDAVVSSVFELLRYFDKNLYSPAIEQYVFEHFEMNSMTIYAGSYIASKCKHSWEKVGNQMLLFHLYCKNDSYLTKAGSLLIFKTFINKNLTPDQYEIIIDRALDMASDENYRKIALKLLIEIVAQECVPRESYLNYLEYFHEIALSSDDTVADLAVFLIKFIQNESE